MVNLKHDTVANATLATLNSLSGRFVTIVATKKDGSKVIKNGKLTKSPKSHENHNQLFTVISYKKVDGEKVLKYASIDCRKVLEVRANKKIIKFS